MIVFVSAISGNSRTFHEDSDCRYVRESHREWPRERAETWDYTPCKMCVKQEVEA